MGGPISEARRRSDRYGRDAHDGAVAEEADTVLQLLRYEEGARACLAGTDRDAAGLETRLNDMENVIAEQSPKIGIAITEGHLSLSPDNANPIRSNGDGGVPRQVAESLPASRCEGEDRDGGRFQRHPLD